ncbi:hypothetical protein FOCC_FOCC004058 [Frankliniella occidentalis]|nr:hypothetical protein FOCC_FOCC004058 [Frankliniella occidentalis]
MAAAQKAGTDLVFGPGVKNWKKAADLFEKHSKAIYHNDAVKVLVAKQGQPHSSVATQVTSARNEQQNQARVALEAIMKSMLLLGRQGVAMRGSDSDGGNFNALLQLLTQYCPELKDLLTRKKNCTSPQIQNEIAQIAAHKILNDKREQIRNSEFFSLIMDEASDEGTKKQMSINVRVVNEDLESEEIFLGLYEVSSTTGENLIKVALDALTRLQLPLANLRGQTYDAGSNMRGAVKGVQGRIRELQPLAVYVHCFNHSLNLALQDTAKSVTLVRDCTDWTREVANMIRRSPHRRAMFDTFAQEHPEAKGTNLQPVCATRWTMRTPATTGVLDNYPAVIETLDEIGASTADGATTAAGLAGKLKKGSTYLGILLSREIFSPCDARSWPCRLHNSPNGYVFYDPVGLGESSLDRYDRCDEVLVGPDVLLVRRTLPSDHSPCAAAALAIDPTDPVAAGYRARQMRAAIIEASGARISPAVLLQGLADLLRRDVKIVVADTGAITLVLPAWGSTDHLLPPLVLLETAGPAGPRFDAVLGRLPALVPAQSRSRWFEADGADATLVCCHFRKMSCEPRYPSRSLVSLVHAEKRTPRTLNN